MGGGVSRLSDAAASGITKLGFKPQAPSDATAVVGATFDRTLLGYPGNIEVTHNFAYTAASGAAAATITVLTQIYHGDASNMSDEAVLKSKSVVITWASDAAKSFLVSLSANLGPAKRYVRCKFTQTKSGTITVTTPLVSQIVRFNGLYDQPNASYAAAGYYEFAGGAETLA